MTTLLYCRHILYAHKLEKKIIYEKKRQKKQLLNSQHLNEYIIIKHSIQLAIHQTEMVANIRKIQTFLIV